MTAWILLPRRGQTVALLLQGSVSLLSAGKIAGREALADLASVPGTEQGTLAAGISASAVPAGVVVMVGVVSLLRAGCALKILLDSRDIRLCSGKIANLKVPAQLLEIGGETGWGLVEPQSWK